jgi:hypothetical protein
MASQNCWPLTPEEKVPPKLTATSFAWANPALARKRKTSRTAKRFPTIVCSLQILFKTAQSHQFLPIHPWEGELLPLWNAQGKSSCSLGLRHCCSIAALISKSPF